MKALFKKNRTMAWIMTTASNALLSYVIANNMRLIQGARATEGSADRERLSPSDIWGSTKAASSPVPPAFRPSRAERDYIGFPARDHRAEQG